MAFGLPVEGGLPVGLRWRPLICRPVNDFMGFEPRWMVGAEFGAGSPWRVERFGGVRRPRGAELRGGVCCLRGLSFIRGGGVNFFFGSFGIVFAIIL